MGMRLLRRRHTPPPIEIEIRRRRDGRRGRLRIHRLRLRQSLRRRWHHLLLLLLLAWRTKLRSRFAASEFADGTFLVRALGLADNI